MTKLQEKLLLLKSKRDKVSELFGSKDVADLSAETLTEIKSLNDDIDALKAECKQLEDLEALRDSNSNGLASFKHQATETNKPAGNTVADNTAKKAYELEFVKTQPRLGAVKSFKGPDAELKAYQFAQWFMGTVLNEEKKFRSALTEKAAQYCKDWGFNTKAHSEGVNTLGGYTVPVEFSNDIIDLREQYGVLRRVIKQTPMSSETKTVLKRTSGLTVYYPGEGVAGTASDKGWAQVELKAREYVALSLYSSQLSEDSAIDIGNDLAQEVAYAFALAEDTNGFTGDGTSTYGRTTGLLTRLKDVWTTSGGAGLILGAGNAYSELTLTNFRSMLASLPLYARTGAAWMCSSPFFHNVMLGLQLAANGNNVSDIASGGQFRFLGYPVIESQVFPSTEANSQVCCTLGNYALAGLMGDRRGISLDVSTEYKWAERQIAVMGTQRVDVNWHSVGDGTTQGPVIGLITAAS